MTKHTDFDLWLSKELREGQPYLEDEGFSTGVMAALPARPRTRRLGTILWTLVLAISVGLLALSIVPDWTWIMTLADFFVSLPLVTLLLIGLGTSLCLALFAGLLLWQESSPPR